VARAAADLAERSGAHVGEFIVGDRRCELMRTIAECGTGTFDVLLAPYVVVICRRYGSATVVSAGLLSIQLIPHPPIYGILGFIISLIPIYTVAITISNRLMTLFRKAAFLPKMALKQGLTEDISTMVVIPALVTNEDDGVELVQKMEVYWAANQQPHLYFTLLCDFKEDKNEIAAYDEGIIEKVEQLISVLNQKYDRKIFFYAQRKRTRITESGRLELGTKTRCSAGFGT
jgi:hypothetical protein